MKIYCWISCLGVFSLKKNKSVTRTFICTRCTDCIHNETYLEMPVWDELHPSYGNNLNFLSDLTEPQHTPDNLPLPGFKMWRRKNTNYCRVDLGSNKHYCKITFLLALVTFYFVYTEQNWSGVTDAVTWPAAALPLCWVWCVFKYYSTNIVENTAD